MIGNGGTLAWCDVVGCSESACTQIESTLPVSASTDAIATVLYVLMCTRRVRAYDLWGWLHSQGPAVAVHRREVGKLGRAHVTDAQTRVARYTTRAPTRHRRAVAPAVTLPGRWR